MIDAAALIVLKAIAFQDLSSRKREGGRVESRDIRKHKNDIYRLVNILDFSNPCPLEECARKDLEIAFETLAQTPVDLQG